VTVPVLAIAGAGDELMCHPECSEEFVSYLINSEVTHRTFGLGDAGLTFNPDHMSLVTSVKSKPVWEYAVSWLDGLSQRG